ncbi:hypothetical protein F0562_004850 [Nyssa sinensis]|uniref:Secreted protein n=1 Tax=Nyssa sinensis TaxID=561372 RepID=A0A5J5AM51_9ASTE|nr:hypothetical protein F0562_004850 [Nyssa sinensis]
MMIQLLTVLFPCLNCDILLSNYFPEVLPGPLASANPVTVVCLKSATFCPQIFSKRKYPSLLFALELGAFSCRMSRGYRLTQTELNGVNPIAERSRCVSLFLSFTSYQNLHNLHNAIGKRPEIFPGMNLV